MESLQNKLPPNPRESANIFSVLTFWWTLGIFKKGVKKTLDTSDLFSANKNDRSMLLGDNLARNWDKHMKKGKSSLLKAIGSSFKLELIQLGMLQLSVQMIKALSIPYFLGQFLLYFREGSDVPRNTAARNAICILCSLGYVVLVGNKFQSTAQHLGMRIRIAVCSLIYRKTLRLSQTALSDTNPGKVINLISNDVSRFDYVTLAMNALWISPFNSIFIIYFLWSEAGWASVPGIIILLLVLPVQSYFGKLTATYRYKISVETDDRVRLMEEIISGCHVIKMYAWEKPFAKLIQIVRKLELKSVRKSNLLRTNYLGLIFLTYRIAIFATVVTLVLMKESITASKVFSILAFYSALSMQITRYFYHGYSDVAEIRVVIKRLQKFLEYDEICVADQQKSKEYENGSNHTGKGDHGEKVQLLNQQLPNNVAISLNNANARWNILNEVKQDNAAFSLKNINVDFKKGMLIGIIGPVGSGKTSLLQTLLQELPLTSGSVLVDGNLSYASQEPWVFAGSVRQNIIFGQQMDQPRYDRTVRACALLADFKQFPQGDTSYVGAKGAALSGGQKARINLARAIYRKADIYLLDDPLSAVDAHVGRHLFNSVIGPNSYLAEMKTTRILVTHQIHFLSKADWIISLKDGTVEYQGTVLDLSRSGLNVATLFNSNETESDRESIHASQQSLSNGAVVDTATEEAPLLQNVEQTSKDQIAGSLLGNFIKCGATPCRIILFVGLFIGTQLFSSTIDWWLSYFVSREELRTSLALNTTHSHSDDVNLWSTNEYLCVHTGLFIIFIIVIGLRAMITSTTMANLSQGLHDQMFTGVVSSPLRFFDINPSGRILNRFSKDLGNADELLPKTLCDTIQTCLNIPGAFIVVTISFPLLAIPLTIMLVAFIFLTRTTLKTSNDIKRIEGITRSPVFSHIASSLTGLSTIRAFTAEKILIQEFDSHQDIHSGAFFMYIYTSTAFGFALEMMSFISVLTTIILILLVDSDSLPANKIGLIITQSLIIQDILYVCAKQFAGVCNIMMGVERLLEYKNLPGEKQPDIPKQVSINWPSQGKLEFRKVNYRYFDEGVPALTDLNFTINVGEKIGIVGRTGAGKSSLIGAIFRLAELDGNIFIDDIDTGSILLKDLRTRVSIIPQDPVLFSGTLRRNLDPFEEFEDAQLWKVLEAVELKNTILSSGLESKVLTGGSNFSVGQRQLLCLARALLRNNKMLILDEATANVDPNTDFLIQRTIREKFVKCTVLTVAHRLHTILDSDRVLVMDLGKIVEFAAPRELLEQSDGIFKEMIEATGPTESERLKNLVYQQSAEKLQITNQIMNGTKPENGV